MTTYILALKFSMNACGSGTLYTSSSTPLPLEISQNTKLLL